MHRRQRHIEKIMLKRAKMYPALGVLGPRQVGKSTYLKEQWAALKDAAYLTFDRQEVVIRAKNSPEQLILSESYDQTKHLIIDEAQKVPQIFDSIKALIDEDRRVGAYTLSGSVEFSEKSGVRESLAGRMGIIHLYPLTVREMDENPFAAPWVTFDFEEHAPAKVKTIEKWLERGGMPVFSCFSDRDERIISIRSWLDAICYRDLMQLKGAEYDGDVAFSLLKMLALKSNTLVSAAHLQNEVGASAHSVNKHLDALCALFLIYKVKSIENPSALPMYTIFDAGVLNALLNGQVTPDSRHASLVAFVTNEIYAQYEYAGKIKPKLYYYQSRGGASIDLVLEADGHLIGVDCITNIDVSPYRVRGMKSFLKKYPNAKGYIVAPVQSMYKLEENITVVPWTVVG